jgi:hypothetical protein
MDLNDLLSNINKEHVRNECKFPSELRITMCPVCNSIYDTAKIQMYVDVNIFVECGCGLTIWSVLYFEMFENRQARRALKLKQYLEKRKNIITSESIPL